ncbi:DUF192 domain-containing protein [Caenispirillum bisanense]|uniref:DUF192 domain-containing protein n=1 Tax=Caenispirillum bisanense TaxID=414052 RepID=A0A286GME7_9PROT|nr:DUF192 domain-containing protein [Caenispirillum bisanense]SOD96680.1 hypothetical protein SAMN05421508_10638 [Caenispirillum bisanense]
MRRRLLPLALAAMLAAAAPAAAGQPEPQSLPTEPVVVLTHKGAVTFTAEVADDHAERAIGLMFRTDLAPHRGMLFDYKEPQAAFMWMKNTLIPLDMLFIAPDGVILHVERNAQPGDLTARGTQKKVRGVLELPAGTAEELGIVPGMIVQHRIFGNPPPRGG